MGAEVLEGGSGQEICVRTSQLVVPGDRGQMVAGHPADAAHRDLLLREAADQFNLMLLQARTIEGSIFCFGEIGPAMLAEILLVPSSVSAIFDKIFPRFDQEKIACRVLAGHRTGTATARHDQKYAGEVIKICE